MKYIWEFDPAINSYNDWHSKYDGTIVLLDRHPAIVSINDTYTNFHLLDTKGNAEQKSWSNKVKNSDSYPSISKWLPKSGWYYNTDGLPLYVTRTANRQWRRSMYSSTHVIRSPYKACRNTNVCQFKNFMGIWNREIKPTYYSLTSAWETLNQRKEVPGFILDKDFSLMRHSGALFAVYSSAGLVSLVDRREPKIVTSPLVIQEMYDLVQKESIQWKIKKSPFLL